MAETDSDLDQGSSRWRRSRSWFAADAASTLRVLTSTMMKVQQSGLPKVRWSHVSGAEHHGSRTGRAEASPIPKCVS